MKKLQLTLNKNVRKKDYKWLDRDYKKDETVLLFRGNTYNCIGPNGLACALEGEDSFFELPATALCIKYEVNTFGIFMTEERAGQTTLYCKEFPMNRMELLSKIQSNNHLVPTLKEKNTKQIPETDEAPVLKIIIDNKKIAFEMVTIRDIVPLFQTSVRNLNLQP